MAEQLIRTEQDVNVLRHAHKDYVALLIHLQLWQEGPSRALQHRVWHCDDPEKVRAVFHHMNCQVLRIISALPVCNQNCCCRCPAATQIEGCNYELLNPLTTPDVTRN